MSCLHQNITNLDYQNPAFSSVKTESVANRVCLSCLHHWHGPLDAIKEYTKAEWDAWVNVIEAAA